MITSWIGRALSLVRPERTTHPLLGRRGPLDGVAPLASAPDPAGRLAEELDRARRYEHALSIVVLSTTPLPEGLSDAVPPNGNGNGTRTIETSFPQVMSLLAAAALREFLRKSDVVCHRPVDGSFVIALAESDADKAGSVLERIEDLFRRRLGLGADVGVARFPEDGLTLDDLVAKAAMRAARAESGDTRGPSAATRQDTAGGRPQRLIARSAGGE